MVASVKQIVSRRFESLRRLNCLTPPPQPLLFLQVAKFMWLELSTILIQVKAVCNVNFDTDIFLSTHFDCMPYTRETRKSAILP